MKRHSIYEPGNEYQYKDCLHDKKLFFAVDDCGQSPYRHYLKSRLWKARRKKKLQSIGYKCEKCGQGHGFKRTLDVHHLSYKNVTQERMEDLQVLCRTCHSKQHNTNKITPR